MASLRTRERLVSSEAGLTVERQDENNIESWHTLTEPNKSVTREVLFG